MGIPKSKKEVIIVCSILAGALLFCFLFMLFAGLMLGERSKVNDFSDFKSLPLVPTRIECTLVDEQGAEVTFEITGHTNLEKVSDFLFERVYKRSGKKVIDGGGVLKLYDDGGKMWEVPLWAIKSKNGYYYVPKKDKENDELILLLNDLALLAQAPTANEG